MFRSYRMTYCNMFLQPEAAFETMSHLGDMCCVQFVDMNADVAPYLRNYVPEVCRCSEMERQLNSIESEIRRENIPIKYPPKIPGPIHPTEMLQYESMIEKWEKDIEDMTLHYLNLMQSLLELKEMRYALTHLEPLFEDAEIAKEAIRSKREAAEEESGDVHSSNRLYVMTGVVRRTQAFAFELMLWRISRGNIYYRLVSKDEALVDPNTGLEINKVAFLTICQGEMLGLRMEKVFNGFKVNLYPIPETHDARKQALVKVQKQIKDSEKVLEEARYYRCNALLLVAKQLRTWTMQVRKTKAIYHNMNMLTMDITKNCLIGQCWIPTHDLRRVRDTLEYCSSKAKTTVPSFLILLQLDETDNKPPTYYQSNKFIYGFQALIDSYDHAKYREINPALYTIITLPFLFALMFGDVGHALILIIIALWMIVLEKKYLRRKGGEIWNIFFGGRYIILLMGLFSLYAGFLFNSIFGKTFNIYSSMWRNTQTEKELNGTSSITMDSQTRLHKPYMFGIDPIWKMTKNKISFENSVKMKTAFIFGVCHMLFGFLLCLFNHIQFKKFCTIFVELIPQFLIYFCIFFWTLLMTFYKWTLQTNDSTYTTSKPRSNIQYGFYKCTFIPRLVTLYIRMINRYLLRKLLYPQNRNFTVERFKGIN